MYSIPCKWSMNEMCLVYKGMLDSIVKRWKNATPKHCFTPKCWINTQWNLVKKGFQFFLHELSKNLQVQKEKNNTLTNECGAQHPVPWWKYTSERWGGGKERDREKEMEKSANIEDTKTHINIYFQSLLFAPFSRSSICAS